jgi:hypothetical protein
MNRVRTAACTVALIGLTSCSFIEVHQGAENVRVVDDSQVARCELLGKTTTSALDHVGFIRRDPATVDADLAKLARNSALNLAGDTVVPGERPHPGERIFSVYRCLK